MAIYSVWNWSVWVSCPSYVASQPLTHPQPTSSCGRERLVRVWSASLDAVYLSIQQQTKYWCVINTDLATNAKTSIIGAVMTKANSILARPTTGIQRPWYPVAGGNGQNMKYRTFYLGIKKLFFNVQAAKQNSKLSLEKCKSYLDICKNPKTCSMSLLKELTLCSCTLS